MTIRVLYSCLLCGLQKVGCDVPAREDEDVLVWMNTTIRLLGADHARRSPNCHPDRLTDVMIPIEGADRVGGPALQ